MCAIDKGKENGLLNPGLVNRDMLFKSDVVKKMCYDSQIFSLCAVRERR